MEILLAFKKYLQKLLKIFVQSVICIFLASGRIGKLVNFPDIGKFETIVLNMEVTLVKDYHYAHNMISLTSNLY